MSNSRWNKTVHSGSLAISGACFGLPRLFSRVTLYNILHRRNTVNSPSIRLMCGNTRCAIELVKPLGWWRGTHRADHQGIHPPRLRAVPVVKVSAVLAPYREAVASCSERFGPGRPRRDSEAAGPSCPSTWRRHPCRLMASCRPSRPSGPRSAAARRAVAARGPAPTGAAAGVDALPTRPEAPRRTCRPGRAAGDRRAGRAGQ